MAQGEISHPGRPGRAREYPSRHAHTPAQLTALTQHARDILTRIHAATNAPKRELSRHLTEDGRVSLKTHLFGRRQQSHVATFFGRIMNPATYPLLAAVVGGVVLAGWFGVRHLATSPDVQVSKLSRKSTIRNNHEEGAKWVKHHESMRNLAAVVDKPPPAAQHS